jgi:scyllo-inositol 2-dehydrogenase (NADP+)
VNSPINVGLVGFGMAAQVFHAPLIHASTDLRLTHIVQRQGDQAERTYSPAKVVRSVDALLADDSIQLVVVASPNTSHFDIARRALEAGKHVVVDKPFTIAVADADTLIELARQKGRVLSVFQNRRWDGDFLTVKHILSQKLIGRLVEYESRFDRFRSAPKPGAWREQAFPGSGVLFDLGPHLIDQAVVLFGSPIGVYAEVRRQRDGAQSDDNFELHLEYPQLKVTLKAGMLVCEPSPRFVLYGTEGSFVKYGLDPQEDALKQGGSPAQPNWGAEPESAWGTHTSCDGTINRGKYPTLSGCYPEYYKNVYRAITGQEELVVKPERARDVIRLIELAQQGNAERRMIPVS